MTISHEELAKHLASAHLDVNGVYRTTMQANLVYDSHARQPTTQCAIVVSLNGQADFVFHGTGRYRLEPGIVLVGGLHQRLEVHVSRSNFEYGLVHFLPRHSEDEAMRILSGVTMLRTAPDPEMPVLLEQLLQASASPDSTGQLKKKELFYRLLNKLFQSARLGPNKDSFTLMDEAVSYIQTHYMDTLTLDKLASRFDMKAKYFSHLFRKYVGIAPIDYLIQYRMNRAQELLITGQFPVAAVAKSVGYTDAYYFSRLYKKHKGLPPGMVHAQIKTK